MAAMLTEYIQAAMRKAHYELIENGDEPYYGEIPELQGVWSVGATLEAARDELQEVLEDWILVRLSHGHAVPPVDGIELKVRQTA
jgi:predicted RNase H-like HicB family nuclease